MKRIAVLLALLFPLCGCRHVVDDPYVKVKDSGLNWVSIRHYNQRTTPFQRVSVRIDGSGVVTVREGTSLLVTNPYAANVNDPNWNDIRERRITIAREDVIPIFQMLVDQGLFLRRKKSDPANPNESVFVSANIEGKTCGSDENVFGSDPDLAESLKNIVLMFHQPQPRNKR